jgi:hypothetical protein
LCYAARHATSCLYIYINISIYLCAVFVLSDLSILASSFSQLVTGSIMKQDEEGQRYPTESLQPRRRSTATETNRYNRYSRHSQASRRSDDSLSDDSGDFFYVWHAKDLTGAKKRHNIFKMCLRILLTLLVCAYTAYQIDLGYYQNNHPAYRTLISPVERSSASSSFPCFQLHLLHLHLPSL